MHWLLSLDVALYRHVNQALSNPVFDMVMPLASGNALFYPSLALLGMLLVWKGGMRGAVCVSMLVLILSFNDGVLCNTLKQAVGRIRPTGGFGSMPSAHAANWFAATMIAFVYYRWTIRIVLPLACLVAFSRIYNGAHYPSDVVAGAILGAGCGALGVWMLNELWRRAGARWFPLWWRRMPSLLNPNVSPDAIDAPAPTGDVAPHTTLDAHWVRLGYVLIGALLLLRLGYIGSALIELSEDEAYQWVWSKHLALSYYSKPPFIAYTQFLGTALWGDTVFGVRFFSPVIGAILGILLLRFFAREFNARAGFFLLLIITATPLLSAGAVLMTIDPLSVLFWTAAMIAGWRAVQPNGKTRDWLWVGLWMGFGFLSKYTALFQWLCWAVFFALWKPARLHLRRPGPYLALVVNGICALPVLIWNAQHNWITVAHVAGDANVGRPWQPTLKHFFEFAISEFGLLNPVFFAGMLWAAIAFWRRARFNPRLVFFFSMGAPLFLVYWLFTFHSRVLPNWIAPAVLPLFCLMVAYGDMRWRLESTALKKWLVTGISLGLVLVITAHETDLIRKLTRKPLPATVDPLRRVRGWEHTVGIVQNARHELLAEGKPVFIIGNHYGITGLISFYLPEARESIRDEPLVYFRTSAVPVNQFYYWPGYQERKGENAVFAREISLRRTTLPPVPPVLESEFASVTDLGVHEIIHRGRVLRRIQLFACRELR